MDYETLFILLYFAWAVYSGYKVMNGRIAWLEHPHPINKICKAVVILIVGYVIGAFYLVIMGLKLAIRIAGGRW